MKQGLPIVIALLFAACDYHSSKVARGPQGETWHTLRCWEHRDCMDRAAKTCPGGYVDKFDLKNHHEMMVQCTGQPPASANVTTLSDWK